MTNSNNTQLNHDLACIFRAESGRLLAILIKQCNDLQLAEDALQEAFLSASKQWQNGARPEQASAWLLTVAKRRMIDTLRRSKRLADQTRLEQLNDELASAQSDEAEQEIPDERLKLIFTCCHPALKQEAQIALTLKTLCGLNTREIARALLIPETTLAQRLVRAKQKIKRANIPYQVPTADSLERRLKAVLAVLYLIYNESYSAYEGQTLSREDLALEAIRLIRVLYALMPRPDIAGLLALMLLHHSRNKSRTTSQHAFVPLELQNRDHWNQNTITEGTALLLNALAKGKPEQYQIQASISAIHAQSKSWSATDWQQIILLYAELYKLNPSPVVQLNGLVAVAHSGDIKQALKGILKLENELRDYQPYFAARADIYAHLGQGKSAIEDYRMAISKTRNGAERDYLLSKLNVLKRHK